MSMKADHAWLRRHEIMVRNGAAIMSRGGWDTGG
jgi:hypothetical protein